jgi:hypothetical protein
MYFLREKASVVGRTTVHGKVTVEELDSDDDDASADDATREDVLASAAAEFQNLLEEGTKACLAARERAKAISEQYRCASICRGLRRSACDVTDAALV